MWKQEISYLFTEALEEERGWESWLDQTVLKKQRLFKLLRQKQCVDLEQKKTQQEL